MITDAGDKLYVSTSNKYDEFERDATRGSIFCFTIVEDETKEHYYGKADNGRDSMGGLVAICVSTCGRYLFAGGKQKILYKYDLKTKRTVGTMELHEDWVKKIICDEEHIYSCSANIIYMTNIETMECVH